MSYKAGKRSWPGANDTIMNFKNIRDLNCKAITALARDPLYRNSFFMAFTNIFNAGCGFFFWMIAARLYSVEQVGLATALISSLGLVILFSRLGFDSSLIRFFTSEDRGKIISTSLIMTTSAGILFGVIFILLAEMVSPSIQFLKEQKYALAFLFIGLLNSVAVITGSAFVADRKADHYFLQNIFMALRIPALVSLAFLGVFGIFGSVGLGYLIASLFGLLILHRSIAEISLIVDWEFIRKSFRFSFWNYASSILTAAPGLIIPLMVLNMFGEAEAARYYIAFAIGNLVLYIPQSLGTSLFVEGSHGEGLKKSALRAAAASLILLVPSVSFIFLFGDRILGLLKGDYIEAFDLLRIIALSSFPVTAYSLFIPIQNVRMEVESIVKLNAIRFVFLLGSSYILMQWFGIMGAGYAWIATYGTISIIIGWMVWRKAWI